MEYCLICFGQRLDNEGADEKRRAQDSGEQRWLYRWLRTLTSRSTRSYACSAVEGHFVYPQNKVRNHGMRG